MISRQDQESIYYGILAHFIVEKESDKDDLESLSSEFSIRYCDTGQSLWSLGLDSGDLHFVLDGAFGEYLKDNGQNHLLRLYRKGKFSFSEDLLIYNSTSQTSCKALVPSKVASISRDRLLQLTSINDIGSRLISALINFSMTEYRNTTYEMLQNTGQNRLKAALEQFPDLLNIIPRRELADYLGISRASLFRTLKLIGYDKV